MPLRIPVQSTSHKVQKFSDKPMKSAPTAEEPVEQLISPGGAFKGSNKYVSTTTKGSTAPSSFLNGIPPQRHGVEGLQRNQKEEKPKAEKEGR
jgi:predicted nucleic acid-binding Zn ribbon protein